jgi:uncharacterized protein (TIGR02996 family)
MNAATSYALAGIQDEVRSGDDTALAVWADMLEEQGDTAAAQAIRTMPGLAAHCRRCPRMHGPILCTMGPGFDNVTGDGFRPTKEEAAVGVLILDRWNDLYPLVEFLAVRADLHRVRIEVAPGEPVPGRWVKPVGSATVVCLCNRIRPGLK